jgi:hypothetical protein
MRTTLTLEDDVAARLERLRKGSDDSFKAIVNELLRRGLDAAERGPEERAEYRIRPRNLGRCPLPSLDKTADVLAWAEGEDFR